MKISGLLATLVMFTCLFGPTTLFAFVGYKAMETLAERPSKGGRVMIGLISKLLAGAGVAIGLLMGVLFIFSK